MWRGQSLFPLTCVTKPLYSFRFQRMVVQAHSKKREVAHRSTRNHRGYGFANREVLNWTPREAVLKIVILHPRYIQEKNTWIQRFSFDEFGQIARSFGCSNKPFRQFWTGDSLQNLPGMDSMVVLVQRKNPSLQISIGAENNLPGRIVPCDIRSKGIPKAEKGMVAWSS